MVNKVRSVPVLFQDLWRVAATLEGPELKRFTQANVWFKWTLRMDAFAQRAPSLLPFADPIPPRPNFAILSNSLESIVPLRQLLRRLLGLQKLLNQRWPFPNLSGTMRSSFHQGALWYGCIRGP